MKNLGLREFWEDTEGTILVLWAMCMAALLGIVALSFDLGRIGVTQTELQSYADNVALAAAGELDGNADAITRAQSAAQNLISDNKTFGSGDSTLAGATDFTLTFHTTLPSSDLTAMSSQTTNPALAAYVRATATDSTVDLTFAAAFSALTGNAGPDNVVSASAVASFTTYACDIAPMMFCVPPGFDPDHPDTIGTMIQLRSGGGTTGQWGAGNYGFLEPPADFISSDTGGDCDGFNDSALEWCVLATQSPGFCYNQRGVDTRPGQSVGRMAAAVNTRFDIYEGVLNSYRHFAAFAPAPNIISGTKVYRQGGGVEPQCKADPSTDTVPLPRDDCFGSVDGCSGGRFGDGDFSTGLANYLLTNYDSPPGWFPVNPDTRYEVYEAEIANSPGNILTSRDETGVWACNANASSSPERRVMIAAGVDCTANSISGRAENVPVTSWVRVFLTEPADTVTKDIMVEVLGGATGTGESTGAGSIHDVVQLHR